MNQNRELSESREVDSLIGIIYEDYKKIYSELYGDENDSGAVVTEQGEHLFAPMDKCMAILLAFYGTSLESIKEEVDELNSEGLSPVKKLILPTPTIIGLDLEFDPEVKFPEVE